MSKEFGSIASESWIKSDSKVFWGEVAPTEHLLQIYEDDEILLDALQGFVESGLTAGESAIIVATPEHILMLDERLRDAGFDLVSLKKDNRYIACDASILLKKFMVIGWPDEKLFIEIINDLLTQAMGEQKRSVKVYGEMVAILWQEGYSGATIQLELLWNKLCSSGKFSLFCAYPKSGFTQDIHSSIMHICSEHTKRISGNAASKAEVFYQVI
jgi:hypothetical protein